MELLELFCEKISKEVSPATLSGYKYDVEGYVRFLSMREGIRRDDENIDRSILHANEADIYAYVIYARDTLKNGARALNRKISAIKCLYGFLFKNKYVEKNIASSVTTLRTYSLKQKKILSPDECRKLLEGIAGRNQLRDTALIMMFLYCGLSVGEACALNKNDIAGENVIVQVNGEIKKSIPKNDALKSILNDFLSRGCMHTSDNVFTTSTGKPLSRRSVQQIIVKHLTRAGLYAQGDASEMLRRSGANMLVEYAKISMGELQYYLGHKNIATTSQYATRALKIGKDKVDQIPLANYKKKV